jgi:hypothetical protein
LAHQNEVIFHHLEDKMATSTKFHPRQELMEQRKE